MPLIEEYIIIQEGWLSSLKTSIKDTLGIGYRCQLYDADIKTAKVVFATTKKTTDSLMKKVFTGKKNLKYVERYYLDTLKKPPKEQLSLEESYWPLIVMKYKNVRPYYDDFLKATRIFHNIGNQIQEKLYKNPKCKGWYIGQEIDVYNYITFLYLGAWQSYIKYKIYPIGYKRGDTDTH